jgi:hypothetical protein
MSSDSVRWRVNGGLDPLRPFGSAAMAYVKAGWSPFALPPYKKAKPPPDVTGEFGVDWTVEQIAEAIRRRPAASNIGLRLPAGVVGIDVDAYWPKIGGETFAQLEERLGPLPPSVRLTARLDDPVSGIMFYRVPEGLSFHRDPGPHIELLHRHWRYATGAPSIHPDLGTPYRWLDVDGSEMAGIPSVDSLPMLPEAWIEHLTGSNRNSPGREAQDRGKSMAQNRRAALEGLAGLPGGIACEKTVAALDQALKGLSNEGRHVTLLPALMRLIRLGRQGHAGVPSAIEQLRQSFVGLVALDRDGGFEEAETEFDRALQGTWSRVAPAGRQVTRWSGCTCVTSRLARMIEDRSLFSPGKAGTLERQLMRALAHRVQLDGCLRIQESQRQLGEDVLRVQASVSDALARLETWGWFSRIKGEHPWVPDTFVIAVPPYVAAPAVDALRKVGR